jgi:hypothetical protein
MFGSIVLSFLSLAAPEECCLDHNNKPHDPIDISNYDCGMLSDFGKKRCNQVWGGQVCNYNKGPRCKTYLQKCNRYPHYEVHSGETIDVGRCFGPCKITDLDHRSCDAIYKQLEVGGKAINVIAKCDCQSCHVDNYYSAIKIPSNRCHGKCAEQKDLYLESGIHDNFFAGNTETPSPSNQLITGILNGCSAGIQTSYDQFIDNRCFGHTFEDLTLEGTCNIKSAALKFCIRAAQVSLTNTDSVILGFNGNSIWGIGLPTLNGGAWNPGDELCTTLDLNNLPNSGLSILADLQLNGHLDFVVQDDTAVDFVNLNIMFDKCTQCLPTITELNGLVTSNGYSEYHNVLDCDCVNVTRCNRHRHFMTFYPGTIFENTIDVGRCAGKCSQFPNRCVPVKRSPINIKSPHGARTIGIIKDCDCSKLIYQELDVVNKFISP